MHAMSDTELIQHVLQNRHNYYRVLMVERGASDKDIKAAYRKMALRCHPDKCTHAHAAEAFKLVGTAYTTLSDGTKRQIYDRQGVEGVQRHESNATRRYANGAAAAAGVRRGGGGPRAPPQNAQEFFQQFFFGNGDGFFAEHHYYGGGGGARYAQQRGGFAYAQHPRAGHGNGEEQNDIPAVWLMLLPVVLFVLLAVLLQSSMTDVAGSTWRSSNNIYSNSHGGDGGSNGGATNARGAGSSNSAGTHLSRDMSLTPEPERGIVVQRQVPLQSGLQVQYYTTRLLNERMMRSQAMRHAVEKEAVRSQLSYLANSCEAETMRYRTRRRNEVPPVCSELQRFRRALG